MMSSCYTGTWLHLLCLASIVVFASAQAPCSNSNVVSDFASMTVSPGGTGALDVQMSPSDKMQVTCSGVGGMTVTPATLGPGLSSGQITIHANAFKGITKLHLNVTNTLCPSGFQTKLTVFVDAADVSSVDVDCATSASINLPLQGVSVHNNTSLIVRSTVCAPPNALQGGFCLPCPGVNQYGNAISTDGTLAACVDAAPPKDCSDIKTQDPSAVSGMFTVTPPGGSSMTVYCDMTVDGGLGWMRVMRINSADVTTVAVMNPFTTNYQETQQATASPSVTSFTKFDQWSVDGTGEDLEFLWKKNGAAFAVVARDIQKEGWNPAYTVGLNFDTSLQWRNIGSSSSTWTTATGLSMNHGHSHEFWTSGREHDTQPGVWIIHYGGNYYGFCDGAGAGCGGTYTDLQLFLRMKRA